ncbi:phospholipase D family protein [Peribacillus asahii]|uniref:phospholipase D family protein n=1 Tax=Peribacillus asahii TaxID=228899 RepID=UPI002079AD16|nr:phospholipase D family protein [Peribacillus asahii]USK62252.1 phospholipase D family protein [Peribacillus asahii]
MIKAFFSRPGSKKEIQESLSKDIKDADERILIAMGYFSDKEMKKILQNSNATDKRIIHNYNDTAKLKIKNFESTILGKEWDRKSNLKENICKGSSMHHKFIVIDDIVWMGSYNFTSAAQECNWESMIRIESKELSMQFRSEFEYMWLFSNLNVSLNGNSCKFCGDIVQNPSNHYRIEFKVEINEQEEVTGYFFLVSCNVFNNGKEGGEFPNWCNLCNNETEESIFVVEKGPKSIGYTVFCNNCFRIKLLSYKEQLLKYKNGK